GHIAVGLHGVEVGSVVSLQRPGLRRKARAVESADQVASVGRREHPFPLAFTALYRHLEKVGAFAAAGERKVVQMSPAFQVWGSEKAERFAVQIERHDPALGRRMPDDLR